MTYTVPMISLTSCAGLIALVSTGTAFAERDQAAKLVTPSSTSSASSTSSTNTSSRVLRLMPYDGLNVDVTVRPGTPVSFYFSVPVVSHILGNEQDYSKALDSQARRLTVYPKQIITATILNIELQGPKRATFALIPLSDEEQENGQKPISMVIIDENPVRSVVGTCSPSPVELPTSQAEPGETQSESPAADDGQDDSQNDGAVDMGKTWQYSDSKAARFQSGKYDILASMTFQVREGKMLK